MVNTGKIRHETHTTKFTTLADKGESIMEISLQQLILIIGITSGLVWYFSKCGTRRMIRFKINWWFEHRFVRWCGHAETRLENWNNNMTKTRWLIFSIGVISLVFIPAIIWGETLPDDEKAFGGYSALIMLIEYFGLIGWFTFWTFKKKSQHNSSNVVRNN